MKVTLQAAMERAREVRARTDLPAQSKVIHDALIDHLNVSPNDPRNGQCTPKDETLAKGCGVSGRTLTRYLKPLRDAGLITKAQTGRAPIYTFPGLAGAQPTVGGAAASTVGVSGSRAGAADQPTGGRPDQPIRWPSKEQPNEQSNQQTKKESDEVEEKRGRRTPEEQKRVDELFCKAIAAQFAERE